MSGESEVSFAQVLATLQHKPKEALVTTSSYLKLEFLDRLPNYDHKEMSYYNTNHPGDPLKNLFKANEHLAVVMGLFANTLIVMVFVRVLGMTRLPSRLIVSLAVVNLVSCLVLTLHTTATSTSMLSNSETDCRFVGCLYHESNILFYYALSCAIVERIIACNLPSYYCHALHVIGPTVIVSPWAFWTMNILLMNIGVYNFDLGYECSSHSNIIYPHFSMDTGERFAQGFTLMLVCCLLLSMLFHNQSSGNAIDIARAEFELRTTWVILKVTGLIALFSVAEALCPLLRINGLSYSDIRLWHFATQLSVHKGISLTIVMLSREEFRQHLVLVFESSDNINRLQSNLIFSQGSAFTYSRDAEIKRQPTDGGPDDNPALSCPRPPLAYAASSQPPDLLPKSASLLVRDVHDPYDMPEWLRRREPEPEPTPIWTLARFLGRPKSSAAPSVASEY